MFFLNLSRPTMTRLHNRLAPSRVTGSDLLSIWKRMEEARRRGCVRVPKPETFPVGQDVRISKEKMHFTNAAEQNSASRFSGKRK